jgi:GntR family transcriptional regulator
LFDDIEPGSPTPLYAQIGSRIRVAVAAGELPPGTALPSVRQLASRLRVNPATVVQAYRELESEGFVEMRQGAGTFVLALSGERRAGERQAMARNVVAGMLAEAARLGLTTVEVKAALDRELDGRGT